MLTIYKNEMRALYKSLLIWTICVGGMGLACILLYSSMQDQMQGMADSFASMGAFSEAFGMKQLSIATLIGYYATEIGVIHGLGGAMFAAIISTTILSKEEDGHTSEFLLTLPIARSKVVASKWLVTMSLVVVFNVLCVVMYIIGFVILGEEIPGKEFALYHGMQTLMQLEVASICFGVSACLKKNKMGFGLGLVLLLYGFDLIARVVPKIADVKIISPFSYANAADIFSKNTISAGALIIGCIVFFISMTIAFGVYTKRDLAT